MILVEKKLNVSFSKVKYHDIALRIGLDSGLGGDDMQTFDIHRARIPTSLCKQIVEDLDIVMNQYGEPRSQKNEEARSRFLAPVSRQRPLRFSYLFFSLLNLLPAFQSHYCTS